MGTPLKRGKVVGAGKPNTANLRNLTQGPGLNNVEGAYIIAMMKHLLISLVGNTI